ncbi:MAG: ATP-binding cassette domain-containing protein [Actinomycetota bacterium]
MGSSPWTSELHGRAGAGHPVPRPNRAGKTTTLRVLLGLVAPTAGHATFGGVPYRELPDPVSRVGAQPEGSGAHPGRKAVDHLRLLTTVAGLPAARAEEVLEVVGLTGAAQRRVRGFSPAEGGVVLFELVPVRSNLEDVFLELTSSQGARP